MNRETIAKKIKNYNGNSFVKGVLSNGQELVLNFEISELKENELFDYSTGLIFKIENFKELKNFSEHIVYRDTKNHDAREAGKFLEGGQNIRR